MTTIKGTLRQEFRLLQYLTIINITLWAQDFYEVILDEAKGWINYHLSEIKSEWSNCCSRILTEINTNSGFQSFFYILLTSSISTGNIKLTVQCSCLQACCHFFNSFKFLKSRHWSLMTIFSFLRNVIIHLHCSSETSGKRKTWFCGQSKATAL